MKDQDQEDVDDTLFSYSIEGYKTFSNSILWNLMRKFYSKSGIEAWSKGIVPSFITSNVFIANAYAKLIYGYLQDLVQKNKISKEKPIYIIELGAGSGKFAFLLIKKLLELMDCEDEYSNLRMKYIMTDFTDVPFLFWRKHPALQKYFHSGLLDMAVFDGAVDKTLALVQSGTILQPGSLENSPIIIANYLFDTLPCDIYSFEQGQLYQGLVSIFSKQEEPDPEDPKILERFQPKYDWIPVVFDSNLVTEGDDDVENGVIQSILLWYQKNLSRDAAFSMPTVSWRCLNNLRQLSKHGHMMIIGGDKGYSTTLGFLQSSKEPHIAVHGSFSMMVNFHAMGLWCDAHGGFGLHCPLEEATLNVSIFILDGKTSSPSVAGWNCLGDADPHRLRTFPRLQVAFRDAIATFGPDQFFQLQSMEVLEGDSERSISVIIALLHLSGWEADLVYKWRDTVIASTRKCSTRQLVDIRRGLEKAWDQYYLLERDRDLAFELGRFFYGTREFERALMFYSRSLENAGPHCITFHNIGLCHSSLGNKRKALECFERSVALDPSYEKARERLEITKAEIQCMPCDK